MSRALVLSAGGFFGAYQVGVWQEIHEEFQPDIVVGASIGSLNAWAIAGGATGDELAHTWTEAISSARLRFRLGSPVSGFLDPTSLETWSKRLYHRYLPQQDPAHTECVIVITKWTRL